MRTASIRVPASTSNLGSAFDSVGLALQLYLELEVRELEAGEASRIHVAGQDAQLIPPDDTNLIRRAMTELASEHAAHLPPFELRIMNEIPIAKGLGSSAAALLAAAAAARFLCRLELPSEALLKFAAVREGHPDNVAPALWGGLVASMSGDAIYCSRAEFPAGWTVVAVTPAFELETKRARAVLPRQVAHSEAVFNVQRAAFLMAQLVRGRSEGLREAMRDALHQPYRSALLPGLGDILSMEDLDGLLGLALSGAGSTVVAFADSGEAEIGRRMREIFSKNGFDSQVRMLKADNQGLRVESALATDRRNRAHPRPAKSE
jgi:homoserine kinase